MSFSNSSSSPGASNSATSLSNFSVSSCLESVLEGDRKAGRGGEEEAGDGQVRMGGGGGGRYPDHEGYVTMITVAVGIISLLYGALACVMS